MGELSLVSAAKVWTMVQGEPLAGLAGLLFDAVMLSYFWKRRADFGIDAGL